jgi:hypothetical protein
LRTPRPIFIVSSSPLDQRYVEAYAPERSIVPLLASHIACREGFPMAVGSLCEI